jgi:hypothetical protein
MENNAMHNKSAKNFTDTISLFLPGEKLIKTAAAIN